MNEHNRNAAVGIIANPAAGRDIRRLVAQASVFPIAEKRNMITRIFSALGATGVGLVYMMPDESGIADRVRRALSLPPPKGQVWPRVEFLDMPIEDAPADTLLAAEKMAEAGVGGIIVLGGDGTNRLVARACGEVPMIPLSTGTNNVFPAMREATVAGLAAGLVASGQVPSKEATVRNKVLRISAAGHERDLALVDLCVSTALWTGSKAVWRAEGLDQLFVTFAEADAVGLSSVAGLLNPVSRDEAHGLCVDLAPPERATKTVAAPIAPGLMVPVGIEAVRDLKPDTPMPLRAGRGVVALDGEREIEFSEKESPVVSLDLSGPLTVDVERVMARAAHEGLLARQSRI